MAEKRLTDLITLINVEKKQFQLSGLYPLRKEEHIFLYWIRTVVLYFLSSILVITMLIELAMGVDDLSKVTDILYYLMTQAAYLSKLTNFTLGKKKILKIEDHLRNPIFYKYLEIYGTQYVKSSMRGCWLLALVFRVSLVVMVLFYGAYPIFDQDPEKGLPFAGWFPINKTRYRWPLYVLQMTCLLLSVVTNSTIDILTAYFISIGVSMLKMLKKCLSEVDYTNSGTKIIQRDDLGFMVELHEHCIMYVTMIEDMFSYGVFIQFMASVGVICLTGFQMLVVPIRSAQFLMLILYIGCVTCQAAMYCWYGNEILMESDSIGSAGYMSNWYEGTNNSKKVLFMIMERSKREIKLTAGKFFTLSLATLLMILRSSYSYFAVLQRVYNPDV